MLRKAKRKNNIIKFRHNIVISNQFILLKFIFFQRISKFSFNWISRSSTFSQMKVFKLNILKKLKHLFARRSNWFFFSFLFSLISIICSVHFVFIALFFSYFTPHFFLNWTYRVQLYNCYVSLTFSLYCWHKKTSSFLAHWLTFLRY